MTFLLRWRRIMKFGSGWRPADHPLPAVFQRFSPMTVPNPMRTLGHVALTIAAVLLAVPSQALAIEPLGAKLSRGFLIGQVFFGPLAPGQVIPVPVPFLVPAPQPQSVLIDSQRLPDPPAPPARIELANTTPSKLQVEFIDLLESRSVASRDIEPGTSIPIRVPRTVGGKLVETYRTYGPFGDITDHQVTRTIPAEIRYELVVRRWQIQSLAIDRTGKSPNPIEAMNLVGQGVGRFRFPAGPSLSDGRIDVHRAAIAAGNAGSVSPLVPPDDGHGLPSDPLQDALRSVGR